MFIAHHAVAMGNLMGPPPPSETAIAIVGIAAWLFVPWAYWIDRHRRATSSSPPV